MRDRKHRLDRLAAYFSAVYPHCIGGLPEALGLALEEWPRIQGGTQKHSDEIPRDVLDYVVECIATARSLKPAQVYGLSRKRHVSKARVEAWLILRARGYSSVACGDAWDVDHSSVVQGCERWRARFEADPEVRARIAWLTTSNPAARKVAA